MIVNLYLSPFVIFVLVVAFISIVVIAVNSFIAISRLKLLLEETEVARKLKFMERENLGASDYIECQRQIVNDYLRAVKENEDTAGFLFPGIKDPMARETIEAWRFGEVSDDILTINIKVAIPQKNEYHVKKYRLYLVDKYIYDAEYKGILPVRDDPEHDSEE